MAVFPNDDFELPSDAMTPGAVSNWYQDVTEDSVKDLATRDLNQGLVSAKGSLLGNLIGGVFAGFGAILQGLSPANWIPLGVSTAATQVKDGMTALANRTDLLEGVRGFCMAYQTLNVNAEWAILGSNTRLMPFRSQYGPNKGARVVGDGITLDEKGAWRIDAMVRANGTSYPGGDGTLMDLIVYNPDGSEHVRRRFDDWPGTGVGSIYGGFPLVVDGPGYTIRVETWTGRWRWWAGGTMYTFLSAVKYDNRVENEGQSTVPDETN